MIAGRSSFDATERRYRTPSRPVRVDYARHAARLLDPRTPRTRATSPPRVGLEHRHSSLRATRGAAHGRAQGHRADDDQPAGESPRTGALAVGEGDPER